MIRQTIITAFFLISLNAYTETREFSIVFKNKAPIEITLNSLFESDCYESKSFEFPMTINENTTFSVKEVSINAELKNGTKDHSSIDGTEEFNVYGFIEFLEQKSFVLTNPSQSLEKDVEKRKFKLTNKEDSDNVHEDREPISKMEVKYDNSNNKYVIQFNYLPGAILRSLEFNQIQWDAALKDGTLEIMDRII